MAANNKTHKEANKPVAGEERLIATGKSIKVIRPADSKVKTAKGKTGGK